MVKVSHARCRQCGQTRHRNAKANLCRRCWLERKPVVQQQWRDIKTRRAQKRGNGHIQELEEAIPLVAAHLEEEAMPRAPRTVLTPEQKQEIVSLYTDTDTPVKEIASTYGIADTHPFAILNEFGVRWRRGDRTPESRTGPKRELPPHIAAMQEVHVAEPTPAPEPKLTVEAAIRELPPIAPQEQDAAPNGLEPEPDLEGWRVRVEGTLLLHGSLENVLKQIRRNHPLLKVKSLEVVE